MNVLRRASAARLTIVAAVVLVAAVLTAVASAALRHSGSAPPDRPLAAAAHDALAAPTPAGVTARIRFSNHLLPSGALPQGVGSGSALLAGATGRLWVASDGRFRLELQSDAGDTQVLGDGKGRVSVYDSSSNTVYRLAGDRAAGAPQNGKSQASGADDGVPGVARLQRTIRELGRYATLTGAFGDTVAGHGAYRVEAVPAHSGGLLGKAALAWDAANGVPLRLAIYARGDDSPVLELAATDVSFGPVASSDVDVTPPAGARVVTLQAPSGAADHAGSGDRSGTAQRAVSGVSAVRAALPFALSAPGSLVGLPRQDVRLVSGDDPAALVVYGKGLGALLVLERKAASGTASGELPAGLPQVSINGSTGAELATALGTAVSFTRGGVSYLVVGSVPPVAAERAAREVAP